MAVTTDRPRPRPIVYEPTDEEIESNYRNSLREAFKRELSDYYRFPPPVPERNFGGNMTVWPDKSESHIGCDLTYTFIDWLTDNHRLIDRADQSRWDRVDVSIQWLRHRLPHVYQVIEAVYRDGETLIGLSIRWRQSNKTVGADHRVGLDNLMAWISQLEQTRQPKHT